MDWSKAKNILILAFIVTNIFLFYHLSRDLLVGGDLNLVSDHYISNVENHLNGSGIFLETDIPREIISLPKLTVKYQQFVPHEIAQLFLGEGYATSDGIIFEKDSQRLDIESNKRIKYYNNNDANIIKMREIDAEKISKKFLKEKGFYESVLLKQIITINDSEFSNEYHYKLVYHQTYNNRFLGESFIHVYVNDSGVIGFDGMFLIVERTDTQKIVLIPAANALLMKMDDIINENKGRIVISGIEMGYYFNPNDFQFSDWQLVKSGDAFPTWKITLTNGNVYYAEALKN